MSIIHVNQIATKVKELFGNLIDTTDLNKTDTQYELKLLSRCLAAYAVFCIGRSSEIEAASSVIDGADNNGIYAIYYSPLTKRMVWFNQNSRFLFLISNKPTHLFYKKNNF